MLAKKEDGEASRAEVLTLTAAVVNSLRISPNADRKHSHVASIHLIHQQQAAHATKNQIKARPKKPYPALCGLDPTSRPQDARTVLRRSRAEKKRLPWSGSSGAESASTSSGVS